MAILRLILNSTVGRVYAAGVLAIALGTVAALVLLWPSERPDPKLAAFGAQTERGAVERITAFPCSGAQTDRCRRVAVRLESGSEAGRTVTLELGTGGLDPELVLGDKIRVAKDVAPPGVPGGDMYSLADFV